MAFDPRTMTRREFDERIASLEDRVRQAQARLDQLNVEVMEADEEPRTAGSELRWWVQGRALFHPDGSDESAAADPAPAEDRPRTLRQAITTVMRESEAGQLRVLDIIAALSRRGWMPMGKNAKDIVRGMVSTMTKQKELVRVAYGTYSLPDRIAPDQLPVSEREG